MKIISPIPHDLILACSGGVDSMAVLHFLLNSRRNVSLIHINHSTPMANVYQYCVSTVAKMYDIKLDIYKIQGNNENEWREKRYEIFESCSKNVITCHHYDDNLETQVMRKQFIPHKRGNIIRPFLNVKKQELIDYAIYHNLHWVEDPTNHDSEYCERNRIREAILRMRESCVIVD
jgi:tRNA(Ile)-lysidine synthetase-like protein